MRAAIREKRLQATRSHGKYYITPESLREFQTLRYDRMKGVKDGRLVFSIEEGRWPVSYLIKWLKQQGIRATRNAVYYHLYKRAFVGTRSGKAWVVSSKEAVAIAEFFNQKRTKAFSCEAD